MTERERQQQAEIEHLQKKVQSLTDAYSRSGQELCQLKEQKTKRQRGRPGVDAAVRTRILSPVSYTHLDVYKRQVDFRSEEGMEALHKLLATADVFLTNFRTQALQAMGLDWDDIKEKYPTLIFAHVLGYGEKGPLRNKPGFDYTAFWARSGLMIDIAPKGGDPVNGIVGVGDHLPVSYTHLLKDML